MDNEIRNPTNDEYARAFNAGREAGLKGDPPRPAEPTWGWYHGGYVEGTAERLRQPRLADLPATGKWVSIGAFEKMRDERDHVVRQVKEALGAEDCETAIDVAWRHAREHHEAEKTKADYTTLRGLVAHVRNVLVDLYPGESCGTLDDAEVLGRVVAGLVQATKAAGDVADEYIRYWKKIQPLLGPIRDAFAEIYPDGAFRRCDDESLLRAVPNNVRFLKHGQDRIAKDRDEARRDLHDAKTDFASMILQRGALEANLRAADAARDKAIRELDVVRSDREAVKTAFDKLRTLVRETLRGVTFVSWSVHRAFLDRFAEITGEYL